jgi:hypothetical protein
VRTTETTRRRARRPKAIAALAVALVATAGAQGATGGGWHHIQHPALEGRGGLAFVADVVPSGSGRPWLLGGWTVDTDGLRTPTVWSSANGVAWTARALPPTPAAERRDAVMFVARRGSVEIALGEQFDRIVRNAGWVARDGTWRTLRDAADPLLSFDGRVAAAAAGPDRFLAVAASQQTGALARPGLQLHGRDELEGAQRHPAPQRLPLQAAEHGRLRRADRGRRRHARGSRERHRRRRDLDVGGRSVGPRRSRGRRPRRARTRLGRCGCLPAWARLRRRRRGDAGRRRGPGRMGISGRHDLVTAPRQGVHVPEHRRRDPRDLRDELGVRRER